MTAFEEYLANKPTSTLLCVNWDSHSMRVHTIYDLEAKRVLGILQPIDYESIARNPAIQPWSKQA